MGLKTPSVGAVAGAIAFALSVFAFTLYVWISFGGSLPLEAQGYRFKVLFGPEAINLTRNAEVRISGVPVGRVVETRARQRTVATLIELEPRYAPLPQDAHAIVRSKTLLGENYVELSPGSRGAPKLADEGQLPPANVQRAQGVEDVLGAFDERSRADFKRLATGLARALDERGDDINAALGNAAPTVEALNGLATILDRQRDDLQGLVRDSGRTLRALSRRDGALEALISSGDRVFSATARRNRELTEATRLFPGFLVELRVTLEEVDRALIDAAPTFARLRPVAPAIRPALAEGIRLAPVLEGVLRDLRPAVRELRAALPATVRVLTRARRLMRALDPAGRELVPIVQLLNLYRDDVVAFLGNLAAATNGTTGIPGSDGSPLHFARVLPLITTEQIFGFGQRLPSNRFNPYLRPRALEDTPRLRSLNCGHTSNPQLVPVLGSAPPCLVQQPWSFKGKRRSFPHVERYRP